MNDQKIDRINELAHKAKTTGLTEDEKKEQAALRKEYIASFKSNMVSILENTYILDDNGNKRKLERKD